MFPEGPRWHDNKLYFSDMNDSKVMAVDLQGNFETIVEMPAPCSGLGFRPDGCLLIVSMPDRCLMSWDGNELALVCDLYDMATYHCNDMVVDPLGRAYIGNFGFDLSSGVPKSAEIIMVTPDGTAKIVAKEMKFPNGSVITPDHKTIIVAETYGACLTAFDIKKDGTLENQRTWANLTGAVPDGICLDKSGGIWVASPISSEVLRVIEGGEVTHRIPVQTQAYACMLGGKDRKTLFIATSGNTMRSGKIEIVQVDIPGAGLP
ncbi:MAG: SMP-30/gluconolactonase/LRE family protein [Desulfobacula sp.]|nr:SMP-30/gluconolactonase/LRE family protein [Desulfobacula sp.]